MKKGLTIILALIYLVSTSGVAVETHYCMGRAVSTSFYVQQPVEALPSGMCGKAKKAKRKCCHNDLQFFKTGEEHKSPNQAVQAFKITAEPALLPVRVCVPPVIALVRDVPAMALHAPPDRGGPSLCIKNCVFRI